MTAAELASVLDLVADASRDDIEKIWKGCNQRIKQISLIKTATALEDLRPGDRVRISNIKPKYLIGCVGIVKPEPTGRPGSLTVELTHAVHNYSSGATLGIPASCLEKIS